MSPGMLAAFLICSVVCSILFFNMGSHYGADHATAAHIAKAGGASRRADTRACV